MSVSLEEALQAVDLEPGRTYRCRVRGHWVYLQVLESQAVPEPSLPAESLAPRDAWVELPQPPAVGTVQAHRAPPNPPDIPEIPADDEP